LIGKILNNRYEILEQIGSGGMAIVYKAKCNKLNREVAVKVIRDEFSSNPDFIKRFNNESQAIAKLSHPNIVSVYDVGCDDSKHYIVMEYINGPTFKKYLNNNSLEWKEITKLCLEICKGINAAHKKNILHRDIKPQNIMLTEDNIIKVTDFGIAKFMTDATVTIAGTTLGSTNYFSPEQAKGEKTDIISDIYSLGIILYESITGTLPFKGESAISVAIKHIQEVPEEPINIKPNIPKSLNDIIMKTLEKDKNMRYQTTNELIENLIKILENPNIEIEKNAENQNSKAQDIGKTMAIDAILNENSKNILNSSINNINENNFKHEDTDKIRIPNYKFDDLTDNKKIKKEPKETPSINKFIKFDNLKYIVVTIIIIIMMIFAFRVITSNFKEFLSNKSSTSNETYFIGDFSNQSFENVKNELINSGWSEAKIQSTKSFNDTIEEGNIISNSPSNESITIDSQTITFEISKGVDGPEIPDLKGKNVVGGLLTLEGLDIKYEKKFINDDKLGVGKIVKTEPSAGTRIPKDSTIIVYISKGKKLFDF
jgi:serine/threonine-protein kinase